MSTRAHIEVREGQEKVYIYHHHDGYPSGVGLDMKREFYSKGFFDKANEMGIDDVANTVCSIDDGYEIDNGLHGDEEYYYIIDCDNRTLVCYDIPLELETFGDIFKEENIVEIED